ncbi:branched-chain amino acid transport system substrate-binding protein [Variovorax paradoxus]|uniref:ABC transporter substrate-binding protein n=1 Tax=Variovorax paradoxus TaxID=34073 RepID=UPI002784241E|nr:ABC transporter substrate-binding protein [Variovorax paradoxus]MDP9928267.1 branched-chain amino acid transport system substrate-binding protein [Variovorax paradoxus]MDQ0024905.1 branched-chain amino acid transport system substrate-binding protein [Variovorax paradoxus]
MKKTIKHNALALCIALLASAAHADVKVGFLATLSGPSADVGRDQLDGFNLALEQLGGKLGGTTATLFKEDDQQKPEVALGALSKLLEKEKVDVVTGLTFANIMMALQNKIASTDVPFLGSVAGVSAAAGAQCKPNLFVTSWQSDVPAEAMGKYLTDKGVKRISVMTPNFVGGKDKIAGLKRFYKGEIVDELYTPLNQLDFSAELTRLGAARPEAVFAFYPGGLGVTFVRQYQQAGLLGKIPLYTTNTVEGTSMTAMGSAAVGVITADAWSPGNPGAESRQFVAAFEKKYARMPSAYAAFSYDAAMALDAALAKLKGDASNRKALTKAIATTPFKSVRGAFRFGANNFPVQNYHVFEVAKGAAGKPEFRLLAENVLQSHADAYASQCIAK